MMSYRQFLTFKACEAGATIFVAIEAVSSTAIEHPEWDMSEVKSLDDWEASVHTTPRGGESK
jgi:hypothetical protein